MSKFLHTPITKLPATVAPGETIESLNEKREAARKANNRVLAADRRNACMDEIERLEEESDIAFDIYNNAYHNHSKIPGSMDEGRGVAAYYF